MASTPYERGGFRRTPRKAAATETAAPVGQMLHETEERTADLLYELTSVKKMDY